jgi:ABC-2 type transport system permease protein
MWNRIKALFKKEILAVLRDPRNRVALIAPPLLQLFLFSFTGTQDVKNIRIGVLNQDYGRAASELLHRLAASPNFTDVYLVSSPIELRELIDRQKVILGVTLPTDFSRRFVADDKPTIQVQLDGRKSSPAQIAQGYVEQIVNQFDQDESGDQPAGRLPLLSIESINLFNPNLEYLWFTVPSLVVIITLQISMNVTTMSVPREREMGTFDQLLVSPLSPIEIMIGKMLPAFILALTEASIFVLCAVLIFRIPFHGSLGLLYLSLIVFISSIVGIGLLISAVCATQQQALLGTMMALFPGLLMSGYTSPIENMPSWLQSVTYLNPLRYVMTIVKGLFLKDMPAGAVLENVWPMLVIAVVTLTMATILFRRRLS